MGIMSSKKCKNYDGSNKVGYYKGDEPSPKGLGFCAKYEVDGNIRKGKDGNLWKVTNGRWVKTKLSVNKSAPKKSTPKKSAKSRKSTKPKKSTKSKKSAAKKSAKSRKSAAKK